MSHPIPAAAAAALRVAFVVLVAPVTLVALVTAPASAQTVASVRVTPEHANVRAGTPARFAAVALDSAGRELNDVPVVWAAAPFDVAWASNDGTIHTVRQGEVQVVAFAGGRSATATLIASPKPPASVDLSAPYREIVVSSAVVLDAVARNDDGETLPDARVRFESSAPNVARVSEGGIVTGAAPGSARITARAGDATNALEVRVVPNPVARLEVSAPVASARTGDVVRFSAQATDARGRAVTSVPVRWSVTGASAQVFEDGAFVAEQPGPYLVTAHVGNLAAMAAITIEPRVTGRRLETVAHLNYPEIQATEHWAIGDVLYVATLADRVYTYDVSNPSSPVLVDSIQVDAGIVNDVSTTRDGRIGVITREGARSRRNGIVFLDLSEPLHPTVLSEYTETVTGGVHSAFVDEPYVYLTDDATGSLRVIDFSDVRNPREVARWQPEGVQGVEGMAAGPGEQLGFSVGRMLHDVRVDDGIAYLSYWRHGLIMLDVGNGVAGGSPSNPQEISRYVYNVAEFYPADHIAGTHTAWRSGNYLFVGDEVFPPVFDTETPINALGHLHVLDVTDIRNPVKIAEYRVPVGGVHNFWVEDDVLYLGAYNGGIRAIDIGGELRGRLDLQGRELGAIHTGHPDGSIPNVPMTWGAQPHNGVVYATDMNSGLWVARLSPAPIP